MSEAMPGALSAYQPQAEATFPTRIACLTLSATTERNPAGH